MSEVVVGDFVVENSRSRSGRHHAVSVLVIYSREEGVIPVTKASDRIAGVEPAKPTYVRGDAKAYKIKLKRGEYLIHGWFVKNFLGRVKGWINVYNYRGELVYRAKYINGVLRKSIGNPVNAWLVRVFVEYLKIPVRETHLGDEGGGSGV
ncbi:MAG: hypothetical protein ABWW65_07520 [Thermoprotei archaeon]